MAKPTLAAGLAALLLGGSTLAVQPGADDRTARFDHFSYDGRSQERLTVGPTQYRNPVLSGYYPDPSVTRVGDDYYLVNSSFAHFPGLPIFHSRDLVTWRQIGNAIDRPGQLDFSGLGTSRGVFAPDISYHDGTFYIVNTCVDCRGNFVITAKDPAGPWSDPTWLPFEGIDPSIYWEGDRAWIVNNRAPDEPPRYDGHRAIWVQEFDWRRLRMVGESTQIVNGGVDIAQKPSWIEGPHLLKREGWYYLTAAEGGTGDNHSQVVFRSRSLTGPFVPYRDNPILSQRTLDPGRPNPVTSAGHAKLIRTQAGDWWATFLATRPYEGDRYNIGRETFLLPVTWKDGWPTILPPGKPIPFVGTRPALRPDAPAQPPLSGDIRYTDTFDGQRLAMQWMGIRQPATPFHRVSNGSLYLGRGGALGDIGAVPAFLGRRQRHHVATVETTVRFRPRADGERAGLAAVQSDRSLLFFGIERSGGRTVVALRTRAGADADTLVASQPVPAGRPVTLTIRFDGGRAAFDYAAGGGKRTLRDDVDIRFLSTQQAGGFVGTLVGPYAYIR